MEGNWWDIHARLFGCSGENWAQTYALWNEVFRAEGRSNRELIAAVLATARREKIPNWGTEHLQAIRDELRLADHQAREKERLDRQALPWPSCGHCRGAGWICGLPHLEQIVDGKWNPGMGTHQTQAVTCSCHIGQRIETGVNAHMEKQQPGRERKLIGLDEYTRRNQNYREQMERHEKELRAAAETRRLRATSKNEDIQARLAGLLQRIGNGAQ